MSPVTEVNADFTLQGVADLDDAVNKANAHLTDLGITEEEYSFSLVVRLYVGERLSSPDGEKLIWHADITMRGRVK